jgi:hypothetical protein
MQGVLIAIGIAVVVALLLQFTAVPFIRRRINAMDADGTLPHSGNAVAPALNGSSSSPHGLAPAPPPAASASGPTKRGGYQAVGSVDDTTVNGDGVDLKAEKSSLRVFVDSQMAIMFDDDLHNQANKSEHVQNMHDGAEKFDPKTEELFAFLQVCQTPARAPVPVSHTVPWARVGWGGGARR